MLEVLIGSGSIESIAILVAACLFISVFVMCRGPDEVRILKRENSRLRNILAELMLDLARLKSEAAPSRASAALRGLSRRAA